MTKNEVLSSLCQLSHELLEWKNHPEDSDRHFETAKETLYQIQTGIALTDADSEGNLYA